MAKNTRSARPPKPRKGSELILTTSFAHTGCFTSEIVPAVHIVGNPHGFRWFAGYLNWLADREAKYLNGDGGHEHFFDSGAPFDLKLTDEFELIFRMFTAKSRDELLKTQGLTPKVRKRGNPAAQFAKLLDEFVPYLEEPWVARRLRTSGLRDLKRVAAKLDVAIKRLEKS